MDCVRIQWSLYCLVYTVEDGTAQSLMTSQFTDNVDICGCGNLVIEDSYSVPVFYVHNVADKQNKILDVNCQLNVIEFQVTLSTSQVDGSQKT